MKGEPNQRARQAKRTRKVGNELTPAERLIIRWARVNGFGLAQIARSRGISKDIVIAHTTRRQVVPATSEAELDEQEDRLRRLFGEELGVEFESEEGRKLFFAVMRQLYGRSLVTTPQRSASLDQEKLTSDEDGSGRG